jgi:hypothetical protein
MISRLDLRSAWRNMAEQDFISQPRVIAVLAVTAVVSILVLVPTINQNLQRNREAFRNRLASMLDRFALALRSSLDMTEHREAFGNRVSSMVDRLAPTPMSSLEIAEHREAFRNRLVALLDRLTPTVPMSSLELREAFRNRLVAMVDRYAPANSRIRFNELRSKLCDPVAVVVFVVLLTCLFVVNYFRPDLLQRFIDSVK